MRARDKESNKGGRVRRMNEMREGERNNEQKRKKERTKGKKGVVTGETGR